MVRATYQETLFRKVWTYDDAFYFFKDSGLKPLFRKSDERISAIEKLPALNSEGYKVWICVDKLKSGKRPDSFSKFNPWTTENIKRYLKKIGSNYKIISVDYKNNYSKLEWKCDKGHLYLTSWREFQQGNRCPKCSGNYKRTNEEFLSEVQQLTGEEYRFLEEFRGVDEKIRVVHEKCGYLYQVTPYKFINVGQRCPRCCESKGEKEVRAFLDRNNISYKEEFTFDDCRHIMPLRFDFAVFTPNNELKCLIEYDGKQHFAPFEYYGGQKEFEMTQIRDAIKNEYCSKNSIKLIRIPYTEFENIDEILAAQL